MPSVRRAGSAFEAGVPRVELIPAIDLQSGRVVRLRRGEFDRATAFGDDPVIWAHRWVASGARRLHVVDLDGAREGRPVQAGLVDRVVHAVAVPCQVAGGLRDEAAVERALGEGADRVVLGTALLASPALARRLVAAHGSTRIVAALDVRDGLAVGEGWRPGAAGLPLAAALEELQAQGISTFVLTAIARDGLLRGPDFTLLRAARDAAPDAAIIASGGVSSLADVRDLARDGFAGAVLGRALYEGRIDLREALAVVGVE